MQDAEPVVKQYQLQRRVTECHPEVTVLSQAGHGNGNDGPAERKLPEDGDE